MGPHSQRHFEEFRRKIARQTKEEQAIVERSPLSYSCRCWWRPRKTNVFSHPKHNSSVNARMLPHMCVDLGDAMHSELSLRGIRTPLCSCWNIAAVMPRSISTEAAWKRNTRKNIIDVLPFPKTFSNSKHLQLSQPSAPRIATAAPSTAPATPSNHAFR